MEIKLTWTDQNQSSEGTYVYRSDAPIDIIQPPPPITVLSPGITEYVDRDVIRYRRYYYRLGAFRGDEVSFSSQLEAWALPYTGPGPQLLQAGDWEMGYFGEVPASEMFTSTELASLVGLSSGVAVNEGTPWLKFIDAGKVLFIPRQHLRHTLSWNAIYEAGCVYGTDDFGKDPGPVPTNQRKVIKKNGNAFLVRLMTGVGKESFNLTAASVNFPDFTEDSEWDRLFARCLLPISITQRGENFASFQLTDLHVDNAELRTWCQELSPRTSGYRIVRSINDASRYHSFLAEYTPVGAYAWRPILEFLPDYLEAE